MQSFLEGLSPNAILSMPWLFDFWALRAHQFAPEGDWRTWLILGGRGAGKTRAGAEWVRSQVEGGTPLAPGKRSRLALVGETFDQAREVMVEGDSGIMNISPPDRRPEYQVSRRRLVWPNGAEAQLFSAGEPEALRGPQFDGAWADELAKWKKVREAWEMLQFCMRLGEDPKVIVTTTPRRVKLLHELMDADDVVVTSAPTSENAMNLAPGFAEGLAAQFRGTTREREELLGQIVTDIPGALWTRATQDAARGGARPGTLDRVVVAVDPPVTSGENADACGIVVAGLERLRGGETVGHVLADHTVQGAQPLVWAQKAVDAYHTHEADCLVAEVNQGGELVTSLIAQVDPRVPVRTVRATRGKALRAEPVAMLYEQGKVRHHGNLDDLEDQMCAFTGDRAQGSPDRVDALVWALSELMLSPKATPNLRVL